MKPEIVKIKTPRGRILGYRASFKSAKFDVDYSRGIYADANTPGEAAKACEKAMLEALARLEIGAKAGEWHGRAWVVFPSLNGWEYRIDTMTPNALSHEIVGGTRGEAIAKALEHLAQNLWTSDVRDDVDFLEGLPQSVWSEMRAWILYQRRSIVAKRHGLSATQAHQLAGGIEPWPSDWEQVS